MEYNHRMHVCPHVHSLERYIISTARILDKRDFGKFIRGSYALGKFTNLFVHIQYSILCKTKFVFSNPAIDERLSSAYLDVIHMK